MDQEQMKEAVGNKAADFVKNHMIVGLGTGSTVYYFIKKLIKRVRAGLVIQAVSSSEHSSQLAHSGGIPMIDINMIEKIDLTVDGADEIDPQNRMIKGGGGALLREKILATLSDEMIAIVDHSKCVEKLGKRKLPLEILPFAIRGIIHKVQELGYAGEIRKHQDGSDYITDNGNLIYDITFSELRDHPEEDHAKLINIPGVLETGFFFNLAKRVIVSNEDQSVEVRQLT